MLQRARCSKVLLFAQPTLRNISWSNFISSSVAQLRPSCMQLPTVRDPRDSRCALSEHRKKCGGLPPSRPIKNGQGHVPCRGEGTGPGMHQENSQRNSTREAVQGNNGLWEQSMSWARQEQGTATPLTSSECHLC